MIEGAPELQRLRAKIYAKYLAAGLQLLLAFAIVGQLAGAFKSVHPYVGVAGVAGIAWILLDKTTFLPFLGESVVPPTALARGHIPANADLSVRVEVPAGATHVLWWAADLQADNPYAAYSDYSNSGVAKVSGSTEATLHVRCPGAYEVMGKKIGRHVHYRFAFASGLLGPVLTANVSSC